MVRKKSIQTTTPAEEPQPAPIAAPPEPPAVQQNQLAAGEEPARAQRPDPFCLIVDALAGARLFESRRYRQSQIQFDEKPAPEIIAAVKAEGYKYNGQDKLWVKPIQQDTAMADRIDAERLFKALADTLRQAKGHGPAL